MADHVICEVQPCQWDLVIPNTAACIEHDRYEAVRCQGCQGDGTRLVPIATVQRISDPTWGATTSTNPRAWVEVDET